MNKLLTVFTPTFNRIEKLNDLYLSLTRQSNKNFIWLIVDDGSTDKTREVVSCWIQERLIDIEYIYQTNKGKMQALNTAIDHLKTDLFFCVDSDDYLLDDSIGNILTYYSRIMENTSLAGLIGYKVDTQLNLLGNKMFPSKLDYSNVTELYNLGMDVDLSLIFKSDVIKQFKFPSIYDEKFMPENYIYSQIDLSYRYIILNKKLTICEYNEDGYSKNTLKLLKYNRNNYRLYFALKSNIESNFINKLRYLIRYDEFCIHSKNFDISELKKESVNVKIQDILLSIFVFPIGVIFSIIRKIQWRNL